MAKLGEGDDRWIVKEREDGANVNNWHWTSKNVSSHVNASLSSAVKDAGVFPSDGLLAHCRIKSAESSGEASINNRKGRTFLIYEIEMKLKWAGELVDGDGKTLESGSGSLTLPDVSAESLDYLEVEFETKSRGSGEHSNPSPIARRQSKAVKAAGGVLAEVSTAIPTAGLCLPACLRISLLLAVRAVSSMRFEPSCCRIWSWTGSYGFWCYF